jgi:PAS domain S-box-containing protein
MSRPAQKQQEPLRSLVLEEQSPDLYQQIFAHSISAVAIIDTDGQYLAQNPSHSELLGYTDEELLGKTPAIHMGEENFTKVAGELAEKGEYRGEITSTTKTGDLRQIELTAFAVKNLVGETVCYVGIKRDITQRKLADEALRRSEAELSEFFETAAIGLHWVGPAGRILRVNQAELELLGYSREEYLDHPIAEFHVDQDVIQSILERLKRGEAVHDQEARLRCNDGSIKYVRIDSSAYFEHGEFVHARSFTLDVTDRKRTEQRLALQYAVNRVLFESTESIDGVPEILRTVCENLGWQVGALWRLDRSSNSLVCVEVWHKPNVQIAEFEALSRASQFEKGVGLPGRIWETAQPVWIPNIAEDSSFPRAKVAAKEGLHGAFGMPILSDRGVIGAMEFFNREIREPDEQLLRMMVSVGAQIGQFQERRRAEREIASLLVRERGARAEAEQANRLKDEFLATVSHELRTPLNAIMGWARMLRSGKLDAQNRAHALEVVERNALAQKQIIEDILDVSRVITGKLQLNRAPVDVNLVIDAAFDAMRPAFEAKGIKISRQIEPAVRVISGDADRLQQVVWNLLSNAAKFTPEDGEVVIDLRQRNNCLQLQVIDSGPGIDPEFLPFVFERFRQADGSTTRTHGGLGLGLAIVRHLVELHGGAIRAENRLHSDGAIFTVRLPLPSGKLQLDDANGRLSKETSAAAEPPNLSGFSILVVDDETDSLDLIAMELTSCGAKVEAFVSAAEALEAMTGKQFDLLISDISMPDLDGYQLIRTVRTNEAASQTRKLPAVALTGHARAQDRMRALIAGYDTHVAKPIETNELVTVVASLVGRLVK